MWGELAKDAIGILLFLVWLVLPPLYVVALGQRYVRRCADATQQAVCAHGELWQALEDLEDRLTAQQCSQGSTREESPTVPRAREHRPDDTQALVPLADDSDGNGRHRVDRSPLANA